MNPSTTPLVYVFDSFSQIESLASEVAALKLLTARKAINSKPATPAQLIEEALEPKKKKKGDEVEPHKEEEAKEKEVDFTSERQPKPPRVRQPPTTPLKVPNILLEIGICEGDLFVFPSKHSRKLDSIQDIFGCASRHRDLHRRIALNLPR